jgi:hypothetical protein
MTKGIKHDQGKADWSLLPFDVMDDVVQVLTFGAEKYDRYNWKNVETIRYQAAALRHISSYMQGDTTDDESGYPHLVHAIVNLMFILAKENQPIED